MTLRQPCATHAAEPPCKNCSRPCVKPHRKQSIMQSWKHKAIPGSLAWAVLLAASIPAPMLRAQAQIQITVDDPSGAAIAGAKILDAAGHSLGTTSESGALVIPCNAPCSIT